MSAPERPLDYGLGDPDQVDDLQAFYLTTANHDPNDTPEGMRWFEGEFRRVLIPKFTIIQEEDADFSQEVPLEEALSRQGELERSIDIMAGIEMAPFVTLRRGVKLFEAGAIIGACCIFGTDCRIGGAIIGEHTLVGRKSTVHRRAELGKSVEIGEDCEIMPGAIIPNDWKIGDRKIANRNPGGGPAFIQSK